MAGTYSDERVVIDALPYYDQGYDEAGVRDHAVALIQEEMTLYKPTTDYLHHLPLPDDKFETPIFKKEMERISSSQPMETINMKRYELPEPAAGLKGDADAWRLSVENSHSQLEQQSLRITNLELLLRYGASAWKIHSEQLDRVVGREERQLRQIKQKIQEVNWQRKKQQTEAGDGLSKLSAEWDYLVKENCQIDEVCAPLEEEVELLKTLLEEESSNLLSSAV